MLEPLFAWSWTGHGSLTGLALTAAIARFMPAATTFVLARLKQILSCQPSFDTALDFSPPSFRPPENPRPATEFEVAQLFGELPSIVQHEDIHAGNIPHIPVPIVGGLSGEYLDADGQARHYMRSRPDVSSLEAHKKSSNYIWQNMYWAWWSMRKGIFGDPADKTSINDFNAGIHYLAKALHTTEDSYARGHVFREDDAVDTIIEVHIWDQANKEPDPSREWYGHDYYDKHFSDPMFGKAKTTATSFTFVLLSNLDQDEGCFLQQCGIIWNNSFQQAILDNPFSDQMKF
jgi:hypothetical protein